VELDETQKIGMHASFISSIFMKENNRFFTFREIAERTKETSWGEYSLLHPAIEMLLNRREIEKDETYGYCRPGQKARLRQEMAIPKMSRADFDKLAPEARMEHCKNGGGVI
jgi:hypothetical protein